MVPGPALGRDWARRPHRLGSLPGPSGNGYPLDTDSLRCTRLQEVVGRCTKTEREARRSVGGASRNTSRSHSRGRGAEQSSTSPIVSDRRRQKDRTQSGDSRREICGTRCAGRSYTAGSDATAGGRTGRATKCNCDEREDSRGWPGMSRGWFAQRRGVVQAELVLRCRCPSWSPPGRFDPCRGSSTGPWSTDDERDT